MDGKGWKERESGWGGEGKEGEKRGKTRARYVVTVRTDKRLPRGKSRLSHDENYSHPGCAKAFPATLVDIVSLEVTSRVSGLFEGLMGCEWRGISRIEWLVGRMKFSPFLPDITYCVTTFVPF